MSHGTKNGQHLYIVATVSRLSAGIAGVGALTAIAAGFGHRMGLWDFTTGFVILRAAGYVALVAAAGALGACIGAVLTRDRAAAAWAGIGLLIALAVVAPPLWELRIARSVPAIHDITTDTEHPPAFVAVLPLRENASNSAQYGGAAVAAMQREAYPDIRPLFVHASPSQAFDASLAEARALGWDLVAVQPASGRIEATATTFWFGFKDDVVIRERQEDGLTRIDIRSESRVGQSDIGANARRIRHFLAGLRERLGAH